MKVSLIDESDLFKWQALFDGPENTPYAVRSTFPFPMSKIHYTLRFTMVGVLTICWQGGVFNVQITVPPDYPFKPPVLQFKTKIYHPNVADDGSGGMCLGLLKPDAWKPNSKISTVLLFVQQILEEPSLDDPVSAAVAAEMKDDKKAYIKTAKDWTKKYAKG